MNGFRFYNYHNLKVDGVSKTVEYYEGTNADTSLAAGKWLSMKSKNFTGVDTAYYFVLHNYPHGAAYAPVAFDNFKLWQYVDGVNDIAVVSEDFEPTSARAGTWAAYNDDASPDCTLTWENDDGEYAPANPLTAPAAPAGEYVYVIDRTHYTQGLYIGLKNLVLKAGYSYKFEFNVNASVAGTVRAMVLSNGNGIVGVNAPDRKNSDLNNPQGISIIAGDNKIVGNVVINGNDYSNISLKFHGNSAELPDLKFDNVVVYECLGDTQWVAYVEDFENGDTFTVTPFTGNDSYATVGYFGVVSHVVKKINAIGTVAFTVESLNNIIAARAAYNALSDTDKAKVENYDVLTAAEAAIKQSGNYYWADVTGYPGDIKIPLSGVSFASGNKYEIELDIFSEVEAGCRVMLYGISGYHNATDSSKGKIAAAGWNSFTGLTAYTADANYTSGLYIQIHHASPTGTICAFAIDNVRVIETDATGEKTLAFALDFDANNAVTPTNNKQANVAGVYKANLTDDATFIAEFNAAMHSFPWQLMFRSSLMLKQLMK